MIALSILLSILFYFTAKTASQVQVYQVKSQIENVTVLGTNALVTRTFSVPFNDITHLSSNKALPTYLEVQVDDLPFYLLDSSVRISGYGAAQVHF